MSVFIHPQSDVQSKRIGEGTRIWQYCVVLPEARIGAGCNICAHCLIENDVVIGDDVTIKSGVQIWDGVHIEDRVFIGPNVTFTNNPLPRSKEYPSQVTRTVIRRGASIGANATILCGISLGEHCMVGAGAVVTRSVPAHAIVMGNPGHIAGYVTESPAPSAMPADAEPQSASVRALPVDGVRLHRFPEFSDIRGSITVGNFGSEIPFVPRRYFVVHKVPSRETRGEHAHRTCEQFLVCLRGSCTLLLDDGRHRLEVVLDSPASGVHVPAGIWSVQYKYTPDAMLLVFASQPYDPADYIRDYQEFLRFAQRGAAKALAPG